MSNEADRMEKSASENKGYATAGPSHRDSHEVSNVRNSGNAGNNAQTQNFYGSQTINLHQGPLPCSDENDTHRKKLDGIANGLKETYSALTMTGLPWLDHIALSLEEYYVDLEITTDYGDGKSKPIHLDQIFTDDVSRTDARKLFLIEAGPGYGKTTLCLKLLYDWGRGKNYMKYFDLVLSIPLRNYKGNLDKALLSALGLDETETTESDLIRSMLCDSSFKVLLVLDGFDEVPLEFEQTLFPLFKKSKYSHFRVIVTSRPGKVFSGKKILFSEAASVEKNVELKKLFGKFIHITGISHKNIDHFLILVLKEQYTSVLDSVESSVDSEMLECPLFLLMLAVIYSEAPETVSIKTKTGLYKEIHNFIVRRYRSKLGGCDDISKLTLFEEKNEFSELFFQLGELAIEALKEDELSLPEETLLDKCGGNTAVTKIGIFSCNCFKKTALSKPSFTYEPVHKTMLEFWAAFNLWQTYKSSKTSFTEKLIAFLGTGKPFKYDTSSMVFPFLAGLLGTEVNFFFSAVKPYAVAISDNFYEFMPALLNECRLDSLDMKMLAQTLPLALKVQNFEELDDEIYRLLLQAARRSNRLIKVICDLGSLDKIIKLDVKVGTLVLEMGTCTFETSTFPCEEACIQCESLSFKFSRSFVLTDKLEWQTLKFVINQVRFDQVFLDFSDIENEEMLSLIFDDIIAKDVKLKNVILFLNSIPFPVTDYIGYVTDVLNMNIIQELHFKIKNYENEAEILSNLVTHIQLERALKFEICFKRFLKSAAKSKCLRKLRLIGYEDDSLLQIDTFELEYSNDLVVDIGDLCNGGKKSWDWIDFERFQVTCSNKTVDTDLEIGCFQNQFGTCNDAAVTFLQAANCVKLSIIPFWDIFGNWSEIHVTFHVKLLMDASISRSDLSIYKNRLRTVKHLQLVFCDDETKSMPFQFKLFFNDVFPKLEVLELRNVEENIQLANDVVKMGIECLHKIKNPNLKILYSSFGVSGVFSYIFSTIFLFENPLKCGFVHSLEIKLGLETDIDDLYPDVYQSFPANEGFQIDFNSWEYGPEYFQVDCVFININRDITSESDVKVLKITFTN